MAARFIIWAAARTGGTNLCDALSAENEPFQEGSPTARWPVPSAWPHPQCIRAINLLCESGISIKHIPEGFEDAFNTTLAETANAHGYRHIHLVRLNELERLISLEVAIQLNAWTPAEARALLTDVRLGRRQLAPIQITERIQDSKRLFRCWLAVKPHLNPVLTVAFERLTARDKGHRQAALRQIMTFLELPDAALAGLDHAMQTGGQNSGQVRAMLPNVGELRRRMAVEGVV